MPDSLKAYAFFQIAYCISALIAMLYYKNYLTSWEILFCSAIGIYFINNSTLILNGIITPHFAKQETLKIFFILCIAILLITFYPKVYLWGLMVFLVVSFVFSTALLNKAGHPEKQL